MGSIRFKLTLALLGMSFIAIAAVGLFARVLVLQRFDDLVVERSMRGFMGEVADYYEAYGSWEAAREAESFFEFVARTRPQTMAQGLPGGRSGPMGPSGDGPAEGPPARRFVLGGEPPGYLVVDREGGVLLDLGGRSVGDVIAPEFLEESRPIVAGGAEIGLAVAMERPVLTELEQRYLATIEDSWIYALLLATLLAVPVGVVLGNRFTGPIRQLTRALQAMQGGQLLQSVDVRSRDEIGQMAAAFNHMSHDLAKTHEELRASEARLTEQARLLEELSRQDELTRLPNRRAFDDQVETLFARARRYDHPFTLAMLDVDHFKSVNDDFSHAIGDAVLRQVALLIGANIRETDLVARYGGEEFAIAFPETEASDAAQLAERLRRLVEDHDWGEIAHGLSVTLSAGLSGRNSSTTFEEVLDAADKRLYEAKSNGRNQVCF